MESKITTENDIIDAYKRITDNNRNENYVKQTDNLIKTTKVLKLMSPDSEPMTDWIRNHKKYDKYNGPKQLASSIRKDMKSEKYETKRSAKNFAFAYRYILLDLDEKKILEDWVESVKDQDSKKLKTGPNIKGLSLNAAKNFIGYIHDERLKINMGYLRELILKYNNSGTLAEDDLMSVVQATEEDEEESGQPAAAGADELKMDNTQLKDALKTVLKDFDEDKVINTDVAEKIRKTLHYHNKITEANGKLKEATAVLLRRKLTELPA